ncbi:MAG TPA: phosphoribosylformylglycinamidine cyclo-ligase [Thermoanaerobaculia bacterium]|nr:phosphoribosylformylglycinamidine cyclo-ligase [Thermoanaerobaculia bacterium]
MTRASAYREAGVDLEAQDRALVRIKDLARSTFGPEVLADVGLFGGLFRLPTEGMREPVLVASADGVGTKLVVAKMAGDYSTVGVDLVNHCVNDILAQGARPLFFLDYVGAGVLDPESTVSLVAGVRDGCRENGCALLGGELAEMPGFYQPGDFELVGFIVGLVDRPLILDGSRVRAGDILVGLASSGLHTNGYSLARRVLFDRHRLALDDAVPGTDLRVGAALLEPHRSYLRPLRPLLAHPGLHALAHITGGGITDNLPRVLPRDTHAGVDIGSWQVPQLFRALGELGELAPDEMHRVFNMGVGMVAVVDAAALDEVLGVLERGRCEAFVIGRVEPGGAGVVYDHGPVDRTRAAHPQTPHEPAG